MIWHISCNGAHMKWNIFKTKKKKKILRILPLSSYLLLETRTNAPIFEYQLWLVAIHPKLFLRYLPVSYLLALPSKTTSPNKKYIYFLTFHYDVHLYIFKTLTAIFLRTVFLFFLMVLLFDVANDAFEPFKCRWFIASKLDWIGFIIGGGMIPMGGGGGIAPAVPFHNF